MDLRLIGGSLSLFGALILLTILTAQIIRRIRIGSGPVGNCFCQLLAVGIIEILLYGWTVLNDSYPEGSMVCVFMLLIAWSIFLGMGLICRFICLVIEYRKADSTPRSFGEAAPQDRNIRKLLMFQYVVCAIGGLISSAMLFAGQIPYSTIPIIAVGSIVTLFCWVLLIRNRRSMGTEIVILVMILIPLPVAAFFIQWISGGVPVVGVAVTLRLLILYIVLQNAQARLMVMTRRAEEELRLQMIAGRMKPHFLYNSLTSIYYLCEQDPGLAQKAIEAFSSYLRDTMDSFESKDLVPFSWERKQVDHYMFLEKLRFGDQISLQYDLGTEDFRLPPLSVQFLVENAIKHGRDRDHPAVSIWITTVREEGWVRLCVSDNGRGFDPAKTGTDGETHLGLATVGERVRLLCGGSMSVDSRPGEGTAVTLRV